MSLKNGLFNSINEPNGRLRCFKQSPARGWRRSVSAGRTPSHEAIMQNHACRASIVVGVLCPDGPKPRTRKMEGSVCGLAGSGSCTPSAASTPPCGLPSQRGRSVPTPAYSNAAFIEPNPSMLRSKQHVGVRACVHAQQCCPRSGWTESLTLWEQILACLTCGRTSMCHVSTSAGALHTTPGPGTVAHDTCPTV